MRAFAGMLFFLVTTSLHAVPDDVLVPTYAQEGGGAVAQPEHGIY